MTRRYINVQPKYDSWENKPAVKPRSLRSTTVPSPWNVCTFSAWREDTVGELDSSTLTQWIVSFGCQVSTSGREYDTLNSSEWVDVPVWLKQKDLTSSPLTGEVAVPSKGSQAAPLPAAPPPPADTPVHLQQPQCDSMGFVVLNNDCQVCI